MIAQIIELSYYPDMIIHLFEPLSHKKWAMLLYSGYNNKNPNSRFDILVAFPILTLITTNNITHIYYNKNYQKNNIDPFVLLKKYMHSSNMQPCDDQKHLIPFQGGFLGVFGYDLVRYIESIPNISKKDLLLPDMAIGLYRWSIIVDNKLNKSYLVTHDDPYPILSWIKMQKNKHYKILKYKELFQILKPWKSNIDQNQYSQKFHLIKKYLISGTCYQICLAQRFMAPYIGNEWTAFRYLLRYNSSPYSAFIRLPNQLSILSFSPERFLTLNNETIITQPIKGTISRAKNLKDDMKQIKKLSSSAKNKSENLMIVDLLRNDIGKVAIPGSIKVPKLFEIQTFLKIHHMISTITGKLDKNFSAYDLLRACFPGGSITGAPKIQAMKIIEYLEPQRRNIWSGSIGYISCCGNMDTNIIIRTLLAYQNNLFCSVGSGIVFDSKKNQEYNEMKDKVSTLLLPLLKSFFKKN